MHLWLISWNLGTKRPAKWRHENNRFRRYRWRLRAHGVLGKAIKNDGQRHDQSWNNVKSLKKNLTNQVNTDDLQVKAKSHTSDA